MVFETIGYFGITIVLLAFALEMLEVWHEHSLGYLFSNLLGSLALSYYALLSKAWPFVILNIVWAGFAGFKLLQLSLKKWK